MKPKFLVIRYADKVVLLALLALLAWTVSGIFRLAPEAQPEFGGELEQAAQRLQRRLDDPNVPDDIFDDLRLERERVRELMEGLGRATVVPPIRRFVLYQREPIRQPAVTAYLGEDVAAPQPIPGTEWALQTVPEDFVNVRLEPANGATRVVFRGVQDTSARAYSVTLVDREGTEALFPVIVERRPPRARPMPVQHAGANHSLGRIVVTATLQQPEGFFTEQPQPGRPGAIAPGYQPAPTIFRETETSVRLVAADGIRVYRKLQGAPDSDFQLVSPDRVRPVNWERFVQRMRDLDVIRPVVAVDTRFDRIDELRPDTAPRPGAARTAEERAQMDREIHCVFVDTGVVPGENYTYRIVAVSSATPPTESEATVRRVDVPPDVEFYVTAVRPTTNEASIIVRRHIYNTHRADRGPITLQEQFRGVRVGDAIGAQTSTAIIMDYWTLERMPNRQTADMFSGSYMLGVDQITETSGRVVPNIIMLPGEVRAIYNARGEITGYEEGPPRRVQDGVRYDIRPTRPQNIVLYLDKRGAIQAKYQAQPPTDRRLPGAPGTEVRPSRPTAAPPEAWGGYGY